jgi:hypothetical protein
MQAAIITVITENLGAQLRLHERAFTDSADRLFGLHGQMEWAKVGRCRCRLAPVEPRVDGRFDGQGPGVWRGRRTTQWRQSAWLQRIQLTCDTLL